MEPHFSDIQGFTFSSLFDHCPIVVDIVVDFNRNRRWHLKFEVAWLLEDSFEGEVSRLCWSANGSVLEKLGMVCQGFNR